MEFILSTIPKRRIHMLKKIVLASLAAVVPYSSREAAIADGYAPCGVCRP